MFKEVTRATGLAFCISQIFVIMFLLFNYPEPHAVVYTTDIQNKSTMALTFQPEEYGLSVLFLSSSALVVVFSLMTSQLQDSQALDNIVDFNEEFAVHSANWSWALWAIAALNHAALVCVTCAPVEMYFVFWVVSCQCYALVLMCSPKSGSRRSETASIILYLMTYLMVMVQTHTRHGFKVMLVVSMGMLDFLLMIGHSYDNQLNTETVANCRVFYCCCTAVLMAVLYMV